MAGMVLIGGGQAVASAVTQLREEQYQGPITIVASEPHLPYQRPPLSKEYLQGKEGLDKVYVHPSEWYAEHDVDVRSGVSATAIDTDAHRVTLSDGGVLDYEKLLIATGSAARVLPIAGHELVGVHTLRTLDQSEELAGLLRGGGKRVVLIGAGWIGLELAASAVTLGNTATVVGVEEVPLGRILGDEIGRAFQAVHEAHGVVFKLTASVEAIEGDGAVTGVRVDGEVLPADLVIIGIGAAPNVALAQAAGLEVDNGILVDASLRTSNPDVYAAGDVANVMHAKAGRRIRTEHWKTAVSTGKAAAQAMLGQEVAYADVPYFYTDQFEIGMEFRGYAHLMDGAEIVIRGDLASHKYLAFWLNDGALVAGMNVNIWNAGGAMGKLIRTGVKVTAEELRDESVPLKELVDQKTAV